MTRVAQIIFASRAQRDFDEGELIDLQEAGRARRTREGITGLLLYADGEFLQVIEGDEMAVDAVVASVKQDFRHTGVRVIARRPIAGRDFRDWSMACRSAATTRFNGFEELFDAEGNMMVIGDGLARRMAEGFRRLHMRSLPEDTRG